MSGDAALLTGWGRTSATAAVIWRPSDIDEAVEAVTADVQRGMIPRGLGRCYGDAAQNAGGVVISTAGLDRIIDIDVKSRTARVEAGVSLDQLMRATVPQGLWPYVTPGTRQVTVGGAIASDVHGKNHHRDGGFCSHLKSLVLATPGQGVVTASPTDDSDVFWATAGGMGLTGLVVEATVELLPAETSFMRVESERLPDLDALLARMAERDRDYRYCVAWVDCLGRGGSLGRSILEFGDHAAADDVPPKLRSRGFDPRPLLAAPRRVASGVLNRATAAAFNELWYRRAALHEGSRLVPMGAYFHPLDAVAGWNTVYGSRGFLQYQMVVPDDSTAVIRQMIGLLSRHRTASFLAVLKRFGPGDPGPLSFPRPGWTLAVDIPAGGGDDLGRLLDGVDQAVAEAGGRVYLSKDSRLNPEMLPVMYPELPKWRGVRDRLDPERRLVSDLARRLWTLR